MKKTKKKKSKFLRAIGRFFGRTLLTVAVISAIAAAILKAIDFIKSKKSNKENSGREFKEFFNFFGSKNEAVCDTDVAGIITKNIFGATTIDLSGASMRPDGFISLTATLSAVNIIVPSDMNVKLDGLIKASNIENYAEEDSSLPTLYIAAKCTLSAIRISRQE